MQTTSSSDAAASAVPPFLAALGEGRIVDVDVREDLRAGREPFGRIMAARAALAPGQVMRVRAIFEPAPLYRVLGGQGFGHWTESFAPDDWRVWFYRPEEVGGDGTAAPVLDATDAAPAPADDLPEDVVVLDVRGLEPPEPLVRTLEALEALPPGATLVQLNVREPRFLFPRLEERGFTWEVRQQDDELVRVFIRRGHP